MTTSKTPIRVAIIDDQALVRTGLRMVLDADPGITVVGEAGNGRDAIDLAHAHTIDVMLMDVRMPGVNGITATETITATASAPRVIVLTTFDLDEYAFDALRAGASGFLLKDAHPDELATAIRTVHTGDATLSGRVTKRMIEILGNKLPAAPHANPELSKRLATLTPREREVLIAIGQGHTNSEIASQFFLSESTVKTHVTRILFKLQARDRVHLVIHAYEHNLFPT